jgi:SAM-dependent methyltransferase
MTRFKHTSQQRGPGPRLLFLLLSVCCAGSCANAAAIKNPPDEMVAGYSMSGLVPIEFFFVDDTNGTGTHYSYSAKSVRSMVEGAKKHKSKIETQLPRDTLGSVSEASLTRLRIHKTDWIYIALTKYAVGVAGKNVAVIGSSEPRTESIALAFGAEAVTTVEYNRLTYGDGIELPIRTISANEFDNFYLNHEEAFDVIISISSIEHDGLGRYGDPLNFDADLEAMQKIGKLLKPEGLFFLSVPVGPDVTVWNLHRRYGSVRLPLLLEGWEVLDRVPWDEEKLSKSANWRQTYEPVFVLKKKGQYDVQTSITDDVSSTASPEL